MVSPVSPVACISNPVSEVCKPITKYRSRVVAAMKSTIGNPCAITAMLANVERVRGVLWIAKPVLGLSRKTWGKSHVFDQ